MILPLANYDSHPAYDVFDPEISEAERNACRAEHAEILRRHRQQWEPYRQFWSYPSRQPLDNQPAAFGDLVRDGVLGMRLGALQDEVRAVAAPYLTRIRARLAESTQRTNDDSQVRLTSADLAHPENEAVVRLLDGLQRATRITTMVEKYLGLPAVGVKVVHFKVTDNTQPEVSGMRGVFADCGLPDTPLTSLHVDATIADMKAIFFLSDVDDDLDGPFRYVCGSNHPPLTPFDDYVKRISTQAFAGTRTAAARRRLMALPPEDRQRTDFGSDLPQDHALRAQVAEAERTFYTRDVDMVLFDSRGVHRGGIVASGQRAVMQISFQGLIGRP